MRWAVRDVAPPFDVVGYVEAPAPTDLALAGFRHEFRLSRWMNDHPMHFIDQMASFLMLEVGTYRSHGESCACGSCPATETAFLSMGHPPEVLRRIIGFVPNTVLRLTPASLNSRPSRRP